MKKLPLFCLLSFVFCTSAALAYTSTDTSNAEFLADQGIIVKQSTTAGYRLDNTITRAELVGIALKLKGVPLPSYQCRGYFTDVRNNDWICRAVELAADNSLVTRSNARFRAQDNITKAEALAIVMHGVENIPNSYEDPINYIDANTWQIKVIQKAIARRVIVPEIIFGKNMTDGMFTGFKERNVYFNPNRAATRAEVFEFAKNMISPLDQNWSIYQNETIGATFSYPSSWKMLKDMIYYEYTGHPHGFNWHRVEVGDDSIPEKPMLRFEADPDGYGPFFTNKTYTLTEDSNGKIVISNITQNSGENIDPNSFMITAILESRNKHTYFWVFTAKSENSENTFKEILKTFQF